MMRERQGDMWAAIADAFVVPINWNTRRDGRLVMGAGVALQAARRAPSLPTTWGAIVQTSSPHVLVTYATGAMAKAFVGFPTKYSWRRDSNHALIERSARQLVEAADRFAWDAIALPCVGSGLGHLKWGDVQALIAPILDDRFTAYTLTNIHRLAYAGYDNYPPQYYAYCSCGWESIRARDFKVVEHAAHGHANSVTT